MSIFNSLGSNYSWRFSFKSLCALPKKNATKRLSEVLVQHYGGTASLTFKGREALELAFRSSNLPAGSAVGINGFTCYVVYEAIKNAGYKPVFIDVATGELNFEVSQLKAAHDKQPDLKAIVVQNTLGFPVDMGAVAEYCKQNNLMIVEDLAHSTGAVYENGVEAGKIGSFTMLSFSQDKPLDSVTGGALINRTNLPTQQAPTKLVSSWQRFKARFYPFWTALIRSTYSIGIGRLLHHGLKKLKLLATPMNDHIKGLHQMSPSSAGLILARWPEQAAELAHRREIAQIYQDNIDPSLQLKPAQGQGCYLRFPLLVSDRHSLVQYLKNFHIYIGDTWYDAPVGPKKYIPLTDYQAGSCPEAENLAAHIVNLPTHRHVSAADAQNICAKIKSWQELQQKS